MGLGQVWIGLDGAQSGILRTFPRARRRWLDVPIQQRVAVRQHRVCDGILRIELDCTLETLDSLTQTFGGSARRVVTSGSVELSRFLVLAGLRFGRRHQDLRRDWRDVRGGLASLLLRRLLLLDLAIQRRMTQIAENPFKDGIATQRIKLRLDSQPHDPRISDRVRLLKQLQRSFTFAEM